MAYVAGQGRAGLLQSGGEMAIYGTNNGEFFNGTRFSEEYFALGRDDRIRGSIGEDYLDGG